MMLLPIITTILSIILLCIHDPVSSFAGAISYVMAIIGLICAYVIMLLVNDNRRLNEEIKRLKTFERHVSKS